MHKPKYTIDLDSLVKLFRDDSVYSKKHFKTLWEKISNLIDNGVIISHADVLEEIKDGYKDDLYHWAHINKNIFQSYNIPHESAIISNIGDKFPTFLTQNKEKPNNADPWLVAQAIISDLIIITEEKRMRERSLPRVCLEYKVKHIDVFGLIKENNWIL